MAAFENLTVPPAFSRPGVKWEAVLRKENNSLRVTLKEGAIWTPEDPRGPPPMILFGPHAIIKTRSSAADPMTDSLQTLNVLYQGRYTVQEEVASRELAMVGAIGNSQEMGEIPIQYRLEMPQVSEPEIVAIHSRILEAGLRTQNYDKGLDKFVPKFEPEEAISATVAVQTGWQGDHGWAVYVKQGPRRCLLLDTVDGLSSEEALWTALASLATFSPRLSKPRRFPGRLFFPDEATHILAENWDHLDNLSAAPWFSDKSPICQAEMLRFSKGLSRLKHRKWVPQPSVEAPEKSCRIADDAAISRLRTALTNGKCAGVVRLQLGPFTRAAPQSVPSRPPA
jgi:hypothetical protein